MQRAYHSPENPIGVSTAGQSRWPGPRRSVNFPDIHGRGSHGAAALTRKMTLPTMRHRVAFNPLDAACESRYKVYSESARPPECRRAKKKKNTAQGSVTVISLMDRINTTRISAKARSIPAVLLSLLASSLTAEFTVAGTWGQGNWGQMYWGNNIESVPVNAPTISGVSVDGTDITLTISGYSPGSGADGWSLINSYAVTCGGAPTVVSSSPTVRVSDLAEDTEYQCSVVASNVLGDSPTRVQVAATEFAGATGIPIMIIYRALCDGANPPASCE